MTDAPKRIIAWPGGRYQGISMAGGRPDDQVEYYLASPGQPCSTDEFLRRLMASGMGAYGMRAAMQDWLSGDFTAAMDGLE